MALPRSNTINVNPRQAFVISVDEGGSGGVTSPAQLAAAARAGMPPSRWHASSTSADGAQPEDRRGHARVRSEELRAGAADLVGLSIFTYARTTAAWTTRRTPRRWRCGMFKFRHPRVRLRRSAAAEGDRLFQPGRDDHREHRAYPPQLGTNGAAGGPDWLARRSSIIDAKGGTFVSTCQDNGVLGAENSGKASALETGNRLLRDNRTDHENASAVPSKRHRAVDRRSGGARRR